ncbi:MAG: diacylglycerol/lipid kinase family protein [Verrucomicrobiales bacterium]
MRAGLIINAKSGAAQSMQPGEAKEKLAQILASKGWQIDCHVIEGENLEQQALRLRSDGAEIIVVGGGDGTINSLADVSYRHKFPLAVLPLGTHNHFAKDIGMPADLEEAALSLTSGVIREVDLGEVNGKLFLNNSSIGAYPRAVEARSQLQKRVPLKKWAAMLIATINAFARHPVLNVKIQFAESVKIRSTPFVFVGNNEYEIDLFSIKLRSCLNAGKLCVYTARCAGVSCLVRLFFQSLFNRLEGSRDFEMFLCEEVELIPHKNRLKVACDGEVMTMDAPLRYRVIKKGLKVLAPKAAREC